MVRGAILRGTRSVKRLVSRRQVLVVIYVSVRSTRRENCTRMHRKQASRAAGGRCSSGTS